MEESRITNKPTEGNIHVKRNSDKVTEALVAKHMEEGLIKTQVSSSKILFILTNAVRSFVHHFDGKFDYVPQSSFGLYRKCRPIYMSQNLMLLEGPIEGSEYLFVVSKNVVVRGYRVESTDIERLHRTIDEALEDYDE